MSDDNAAKDGPAPAGDRPKDEPPGSQGGEPQPDPQAGAAAPDPNSIVNTSQSGISKGRRESQRAFEERFSHASVRGSAVGGDQYNYYMTSETSEVKRVMRVLDRRVAEIEETFVAPDGFESVLQRTADRPIVIIKGARDTGRFAAARRLLRACDSLWGIADTVSLTELTAADLTEGAGYVKLDLSRQEAKALTGLRIGELSATLQKLRARLVLTVGSTVSFTDAEVSDLVVRLGTVADRVPILERQLAWRLGERTADALLSDPEVEELVVRELGGEGPPQHARTVAIELVRAHEADLPWARTAAVALSQGNEERLRQWFRELPTLSAQCMAVAVAVLGGCPYETVAAAAEELRRRLAPADTVRRTEEDLDRRLVDTKDEWLGQLGAKVVPGTVRTRHGAEAPAELVEFIDAKSQERILLYFFRAFDRHRPVLLEWLRQTADTGIDDVRFAVATATGVLTAHSYELVRTNVILPWAGSPDPELWAAAAFALAVAADRLAGRRPGGDGDLREIVRSTVKGWSLEDERPRLRATAARAWLVEYHHGGVEAVLKHLEVLRDDEDLEVVGAVCNSVAELWEEIGERPEAPRTLLDWIENGRRKQRALTARLAFLVSAVDLIHEVPGADGPVVWPKLLHLAAADPARADELAGLWRHALRSGPVRPTAKAVLAAWVEAAEPDPAMRRELVRLLLRVADSRETSTRVAHEARKWAEEWPVFAREIQQALAGKAVR